MIKLIDVVGAQRHDEDLNQGDAARVGSKHLD
jgi:hypothetical protein